MVTTVRDRDSRCIVFLLKLTLFDWCRVEGTSLLVRILWVLCALLRIPYVSRAIAYYLPRTLLLSVSDWRDRALSRHSATKATSARWAADCFRRCITSQYCLHVLGTHGSLMCMLSSRYFKLQSIQSGDYAELVIRAFEASKSPCRNL